MPFSDETVIGISRPGRHQLLTFGAYNGHKRKHAITFQGITSLCSLLLHLVGPIEGQRYDWTIFVRSGIEEWVGTALNVHGIR